MGGATRSFTAGRFSMMNAKKMVSAVVVAALLSGCESMGGMSRTQKGTALGAGTGAALGALIGKKQGHTGRGALIGGAVGALSGGLIGRYMDNQAKELEAVAETKRTEEGVVVTMKDKILFDIDSAALKPGAQGSLRSIADVLAKYPKTEVTVAGHTDSTGKAAYNQTLSERRANAVRFYLVDQGIGAQRVTAIGFGADQPIASNMDEMGRSQNRRVELHIRPNEALVAESQAEGGGR